jgi:sec-independent protein translocase protein TatB
VFNFSGSEIVFLLLLALIILGPEKLPEAVRKFGSTYAELKKMSNGFQSELKQALDEPMREMRETADALKKAASFDVDLDPRNLLKPDASPAAAETPTPTSAPDSLPETAPETSPTAATPTRVATPPTATSRDEQKPFESTIISRPAPAAEIVREPGLNFGSAAPNRGKLVDDAPAGDAPADDVVAADVAPVAPTISEADIAGAAPPLAPRADQPEAATE